MQSGRPVWKSGPTGSRLDTLQKDIEAGNLKVTVGGGGVVTRRGESAPDAPVDAAPAPVETRKEE